MIHQPNPSRTSALTSEPSTAPCPIRLARCLPDPTTEAQLVWQSPAPVDFNLPPPSIPLAVDKPIANRRAIAHHVYVLSLSLC